MEDDVRAQAEAFYEILSEKDKRELQKIAIGLVERKRKNKEKKFRKRMQKHKWEG